MLGEVAKTLGIARCHYCGKACQMPEVEIGKSALCPRCGSGLHLRSYNSLSSTWALLITAVILFIPANIYPVMSVFMFGHGMPDTIISGIIHLMHAGQFPIAFLVFVASILVPLFKMIGLSALLLAIHFRWSINQRQAATIFRIINFIGPWSMLDLFMISILVTLVHLGFIATIQTGPGATAFAGVVVITMLAAHTFDQRIIWDLVEE